jgi:hypothetical protein
MDESDRSKEELGLGEIPNASGNLSITKVSNLFNLHHLVNIVWEGKMRENRLFGSISSLIRNTLKKGNSCFEMNYEYYLELFCGQR